MNHVTIFSKDIPSSSVSASLTDRISTESTFVDLESRSPVKVSFDDRAEVNKFNCMVSHK